MTMDSLKPDNWKRIVDEMRTTAARLEKSAHPNIIRIEQIRDWSDRIESLMEHGVVGAEERDEQMD